MNELIRFSTAKWFDIEITFFYSIFKTDRPIDANDDSFFFIGEAVCWLNARDSLDVNVNINMGCLAKA